MSWEDWYRYWTRRYGKPADFLHCLTMFDDYCDYKEKGTL